MSRNRSENGTDGRYDDLQADLSVELQELFRRNPSAVAMDLLYLFTVAFFAIHLVRGFWPAAVALVPLAGLLYFGWKSSPAFLLAQLVTIAITLVASYAGLVPL